LLAFLIPTSEDYNLSIFAIENTPEGFVVANGDGCGSHDHDTRLLHRAGCYAVPQQDCCAFAAMGPTFA
jgi:hypothetical protein